MLESTYARVGRLTATSQVEQQRLFNNQNTICRSERRKRSKKECCQHEWTNKFFAVASSVVRRQSYNDLSRGQVPTFPLTDLQSRLQVLRGKEEVARGEVETFMEHCAKRWQTKEGTYQLKRRRLLPDVRDPPEQGKVDVDMMDI